jgi:adenylate kinase
MNGGTEDAAAPAVVLIIGRQGAGKGVQCSRLAAHLPADHVSTGDLLRLAIRAGDSLGRAVEPFVEAGHLVPDELVVDLVANRLEQDRAAGWSVVLDGFPRTRQQAVLLVERTGASISLAVNLEVPRHVAIERLALRVVCLDCGLPGVTARCPSCGGVAERRADDTPEAIERRLATFDAETDPLLEWLDDRGLVERVDGVGSVDVVAARLAAAVDLRLRPGRVAPTSAGATPPVATATAATAN